MDVNILDILTDDDTSLNSICCKGDNSKLLYQYLQTLFHLEFHSISIHSGMKWKVGQFSIVSADTKSLDSAISLIVWCVGVCRHWRIKLWKSLESMLSYFISTSYLHACMRCAWMWMTWEYASNRNSLASRSSSNLNRYTKFIEMISFSIEESGCMEWTYPCNVCMLLPGSLQLWKIRGRMILFSENRIKLRVFFPCIVYKIYTCCLITPNIF